MKSYLLAGACALALCGPAHANLITNGSFEDGTLSNPFTTVSAGGSNITGWTVNSGSVDYVGNYWQAEDGSRSVDLAGNSPGKISTSFNQVAGTTYQINFWLAGNPDGAPSTKHVDLSVGSNAGALFSFETQGATTKQNMGWEQYSFIYTAAATGSTLLSFGEDARDGASPYGAVLDRVEVSAVPLPPALPMFGGALLALGAFGFMRSRNAARSPGASSLTA